MIDICCGNITPLEKLVNDCISIGNEVGKSPILKTDFKMCLKPTKPQDYMKNIGVSEIWRFILTHPDMDHMDGFDSLFSEYQVSNFWDSGARKEKPVFGNQNRYKEEDWDRYVNVRDGRDANVNSLSVYAGKIFKYANMNDNNFEGDELTILAPTETLVEEANKKGDFNDCSFVLLYKTSDKKIIFSGDSHDKTWEYILDNYKQDVANCDLLIAPHHGRYSGRSWDFLDVLKPKLTLFGCADSEHLAYSAWSNRNLYKITNNQAGNIVIASNGNQLDVYVENESFAKKLEVDLNIKNSLGYVFLGYI